MINLVVLLLAVTTAWFLPAFGASEPELRTLHISPDDAASIVLEAKSLDCDKYISKYISLLGDTDARKQCYAAYALGVFQSSRVVGALFSNCLTVTNEVVIRVMYNSVNGEFAGLLPGFKDQEPQPLQQLKTWAKAFRMKGYERLLLDAYRRFSSSEEGRANFIAWIWDRYDPQLVRVLVPIYEELRDDPQRRTLADAILCISGFDVQKVSPGDVMKQIREPGSLDSERILSRYVMYFRQRGLTGDDAEVFWKVLFAYGDPAHKKMAWRALRHILTR